MLNVVCTDVQAAAIFIGYTEEIWDADGDTALDDTYWADLTNEQ